MVQDLVSLFLIRVNFMTHMYMLLSVLVSTPPAVVYYADTLYTYADLIYICRPYVLTDLMFTRVYDVDQLYRYILFCYQL